MKILTHRGLDPDLGWEFPESSLAAFRAHLKRGFGLEFDPCPTLDGIVISHDDTLTRISQGRDSRRLSELTTSEATAAVISGEHCICSLHQLLEMIVAHKEVSVSAMHLKGNRQDPKSLRLLTSELERFDADDLLPHIVLFDISLETANVLRQRFPKIQLAPSVSHAFDVERYSSCVFGTLWLLDDVIALNQKNESEGKPKLFEWVWLDEWDRTGDSGKTKELYSMETFERCRAVGLKIALVSPELHAKSPGLLGGESHPDALDERLQARWDEIFRFTPDAICTDYPDRILRHDP